MPTAGTTDCSFRAELSDEERGALRREQAVPVLAEFKAWAELVEPQILPKGPLAKVIGYMCNQWDALRPLAVGRRNWLFFQREGGGTVAAILMSLLQTAKAAGVNPGDYFRDVLLRISTCSDVRKLTPHGWKEHFEPEVTARRNEVLDRIVRNS